MSQAPSLPLFVDAYLADTTHLSTEEHGAYLLLLMAMWRRGGSVPDDDRDNARMAGLTPRRWREVKARLALFLDIADGEITQKRLKKEWEFVQRRRAAAQENGSRGGRPLSRENNDIGKPGGLRRVKPAESSQSQPYVLEEAKASLSETSVSDETPPVQKLRKRVAYPPMFEAFWAAYPTDPIMSKKEAGQAWAKLDEDQRSMALASARPFAEYCANHPDYRPVHAERYLRQERFVGVMATASKASGMVFVAKGSGEWDAWQKVKRTPSQMSERHGQEGWWFPSQWPLLTNREEAA